MGTGTGPLNLQGTSMAAPMVSGAYALALGQTLAVELAGEVPVGVVTAFIGAPVLICMVRRFRVSEA